MNRREPTHQSTPEERENAFQIWFRMGASCSRVCYIKTAEKVGFSHRSMRVWCELYNWKERRDKLIDEGKHPGEIINSDYAMAKSVPSINPEIAKRLDAADTSTPEGLLAVIDSGTDQFLQGLKRGSVRVKTVTDFDKLVRLRRTITGISDQAQSGNIVINVVTAIPRPEQNQNEKIITVNSDGTQEILENTEKLMQGGTPENKRGRKKLPAHN